MLKVQERCLWVIESRGKDPKSLLWNDEVKTAVERKEIAWKKVLGAIDEAAKERCIKTYKGEKRKVKRCIYQGKKLGKKMNQDVNGNRKLFWKEVSKVSGGRMKSCNRKKDGKRRLALGEDEVRRIWKNYFEDLYNIDIQEQVAVHMCGCVALLVFR